MAGMTSGITGPRLPQGRLAEDQRRNQSHRVGLERVRGHTGTVADVVAHVVRDGGGVAGSSSGMPCSTLPRVRADVSSLGEDTATDTHDGQQRRAEAEALQYLAGLTLVDRTTTIAAPSGPRPTVNMPATPPVRMRSASPWSHPGPRERRRPRGRWRATAKPHAHVAGHRGTQGTRRRWAADPLVGRSAGQEQHERR